MSKLSLMYARRETESGGETRREKPFEEKNPKPRKRKKWGNKTVKLDRVGELSVQFAAARPT